MRFPKAAPYIVGTELAERFSYYGMKAILATFLVSNFFNPSGESELQTQAEARSNEITHLFTAISYGCCILGGFLADRLMGRYKTIVWLSVVYCLGHLMLAVFESNYHLFIVGLMLVAIGAGGVKPNVSVMVGDQFENPDDPRISKLYDVFYFAINLGAFFSMLITPLLKQYAGAQVAFGVPGVLMLVALLIFLAGTKKYKLVPPQNSSEDEMTFIEKVKALSRVLMVFAFIPLYWALWDQNGSEWVLQAGKMDLNFMGVTWLSEQIQVVNAVLILLFIPFFSLLVYPLLEKLGIKVTPTRKIGWGFVLMVATFLLTAWIQHQIDAGVKLNIAWQLFAYVILTASEIMVSITGLEYAFSASPKPLKSTVMSLWFFTVFIGNILVSFINNSIHNQGFFSRFTGADYFLLFAVMMAANTLLYFVAIHLIRNKPSAESK